MAQSERPTKSRAKARNGNGDGRVRQRLCYDDRRKQIVAAARKVFLARGLSGGRTREIADSIGVTEALLYHYFTSKEELFEAAILDPLETLAEQVADLSTVFANLDLDARREQSVRFHQDTLSVMLEVVPLLGVALFSDRKQGARFYRERMAPLTDLFAARLATTLEGWPHHNVDPELLARMILGTYTWIALDADFRRAKVDTPVVAGKLTGMFVRVMGGGTDLRAAVAEDAAPAPRRRSARTA